MPNRSEITNWIKSSLYDDNFMLVGISKAEKLDKEAKDLEAWLNSGYHGKMGYMANHFDLRTDPTKLVPGAKSVISMAYNYYHPETQVDQSAPKISMYAYGDDYHKVIRKKLKKIFQRMKDKFGDIQGRIFVDSAPVMERDWAKKSGLGWVGKHTLLINPKKGSYFFLAEMIIDLELDYDGPMKDYCGTCTRCIDACPTDAIVPSGYMLDASKCISYLTIELKESLPKEFQDKMEGWMFGCDICQAVCPWNRFSVPHEEEAFFPHDSLLKMTKEDWIELSRDTFEDIFSRSAVKRTKYEGLMRNIKFIQSKPKD
jgi:epoxyqueuosine reductase